MKSAEEVRAVLRKEQITHVYINWSEILRYRLTYGYTPYVVPERFIRLEQMGILQPAITMAAGDWLKLSDQERNEVLNWSGGESLGVNGTSWNRIQLYRVND